MTPRRALTVFWLAVTVDVDVTVLWTVIVFAEGAFLIVVVGVFVDLTSQVWCVVEEDVGTCLQEE